MSLSRRERLQGIVVSLPTFCDDDHSLRLDRQRIHTRWLVEHGLTEGNAVFMGAGGLGEGYFLSDDEFRGMVDVLAEEAGGKTPTMAAIFELSAREAAAKAKYAADAGIDFVQLAPPHYLAPSEDDVFGHFQYVNDHVDIGIMAYNIPWAMPRPGFELSEQLMERFTTLENVVAVKWSSFDIQHYLRVLRLFAERLNFIDNMQIFSLGARLGMKGFISHEGNVAPKLELKRWEILKNGDYDEFDKQHLRMRFDPFLTVVNPEQQSWIGVGEGPTARLALRSMGLDSGPPFPAQAQPSPEYTENVRHGFEASGLLEQVEWDQSIFD